MAWLRVRFDRRGVAIHSNPPHGPRRRRTVDGFRGAIGPGYHHRRPAGPTFGGGVIGNTAGSGPVVGGSSPPPRALGLTRKVRVTSRRERPRAPRPRRSPARPRRRSRGARARPPK